MTVLLVDARAPQGSGLGRYLRESVRGLASTGRFEEIVLLGSMEALRSVRASLPIASRVIDVSWGRHDPRVLWHWSAVGSRIGRSYRTWFPHWDGAWWASGGATPPVTTFHDLIQLQGAGLRGALRARIAAEWMARMVAGSRTLITGTEHAKGQLIDRFPLASGKIEVVAHGVADVFFQSSAPAAGTLRAAGVTGPFLLTVANKKPHKNLEMAIRVLARIAGTDSSLQLVMVGDRFTHLSRLMGLAKDLGVAHRIHDLAAISDTTLQVLYASAEALLFTSRLEGFGLPVLEAMAAGAPVIAVDAPPIPSIVGSAADVVPIDDDEAMIRAIHRLRSDPFWRADRIAAGRRRAALFTWERSAAVLAAILCADVPTV